MAWRDLFPEIKTFDFKETIILIVGSVMTREQTQASVNSLHGSAQVYFRLFLNKTQKCQSLLCKSSCINGKRDRVNVFPDTGR